VIAAIPAAILTTLAVVLFGLLSFYAVAVTKAVSAIPAAETTTVATVFGLSYFYSAAVTATEIPSVN